MNNIVGGASGDSDIELKEPEDPELESPESPEDDIDGGIEAAESDAHSDITDPDEVADASGNDQHSDDEEFKEAALPTLSDWPEMSVQAKMVS